MAAGSWLAQAGQQDSRQVRRKQVRCPQQLGAALNDHADWNGVAEVIDGAVREHLRLIAALVLDTDHRGVERGTREVAHQHQIACRERFSAQHRGARPGDQLYHGEPRRLGCPDYQVPARVGWPVGRRDGQQHPVGHREAKAMPMHSLLAQRSQHAAHQLGGSEAPRAQDYGRVLAEVT